MPGTYTGEPIMYPLFGYGHYCDIDNIASHTIPDDVIYDSSDFIWTKEDALYFLWMVRSLTIKVSNTVEYGNPWELENHDNIFTARRYTYPDDSIYERTCPGQLIPSEIDIMLLDSGGESRQRNDALRNKFNRPTSEQLRKIYNSDNDFLGYALNSDSVIGSPTSDYLRTSIFRSRFLVGIPPSWVLGGGTFTEEKYIYPLSMNGITIPISVVINTGGFSNPFPGTWSHTVTGTKISVESSYEVTSTNRAKTLSTIELLDVELYQQAT